MSNAHMSNAMSDSSKSLRVLVRAFALTLAAIALELSAWSSSAATTPARVLSPVTVIKVTSEPGVQPFSQWRPSFVTLTHPQLRIDTLRVQAAAGATVPFWTSSITSPLDGITYTTSMVGRSPYTTTTNTNVTYVPIVVRWHFGKGVLDPTMPTCNDNVAIATRFFGSPLFQPVTITSNGVGVGTVQLIDGFQRANFWTTVMSEPNYGVSLISSQPPGTAIVLDEKAPRGSRVSSITLLCGNAVKTVLLGQIDINKYDSIIRSIIGTYASPSQLPVILTYNVVQTQNGGCCIVGYHNAVPVTSGTQTYAVGSYVDSGIFSGVDDIVVWAHEMGEWMDDPFVQASVTGGGTDDLTPAWGHVGQVSGCQNNLEVGDPLSGTEFALTGGSFTYHTQDLAFEDWFYRTPAQGTGGLFSFLGAFTGNAGAVCH